MQLTVLCHKDRLDAIKGFRQRHSVGKAEDKTGGAQGVAVYGVWAYDGDQYVKAIPENIAREIIMVM